MTAWTREVTRRLLTGVARNPEDGDWPVRAVTTSGEWEAALAELDAAQAEFTHAIASLDDARLGDRIGEIRDRALPTGSESGIASCRSSGNGPGRSTNDPALAWAAALSTTRNRPVLRHLCTRGDGAASNIRPRHSSDQRSSAGISLEDTWQRGGWIGMSWRSNDLFAAELLGTDVLAGIANLDPTGNVVARREFHGTVVRAGVDDGVTLVDAEGREHWLPLDRDAYEPADPGEYQLRSTGEVVVDPTWLTRWTIYPPNHH